MGLFYGWNMKTHEKGLELIKSLEELKLSAYKDQAGIWTIGYGHTKGVKPNDKITEAQADEYLQEDLKEAENAVNTLVKVKINPNMFDALVAFTFNVGVGAFKGSTLLRLLNEGKYTEASDQFARWNKVTNPETKVKEVSKGLIRRREAEQKLFMMDYVAPKPNIPKNEHSRPNLISRFFKWLFSLFSKKGRK